MSHNVAFTSGKLSTVHSSYKQKTLERSLFTLPEMAMKPQNTLFEK